jgi:hypothetical protein
LKPYLTAFREANKKLFKNSHGYDDFLLKQAVKTGIVTSDERSLVLNLRSLRNFCSHFNPYSRTLSEYRKALESLGIEFRNFDELGQVASRVLLETKSILEKWADRKKSL